MRKALQDQQDVNLHLRKYIDSVLLNIMEKYPELLEVRCKWRWVTTQSCFQIDREEKDKAKLGAGSVIVFDLSQSVQSVKLKSYNQVCDMIHQPPH